MVTVETAIAIPAVVVLLAGLLSVILVVAGQLACVDAAGEAARAAGRGENPAAIAAIVEQLAPPGARHAASTDGNRVTIRVRATVAPFGGLFGRWPVEASATAALESAAAGSPGSSAPPGSPELPGSSDGRSP